MHLFLDACIVIYLIEGAEPFASKVRGVLREARSRDPSVVLAVSALSRLECRIAPMRDGRQDLLLAYDGFFAAAGLHVVMLSVPVVDLATEIRAGSGLRTPDALQAANCLSLGPAARFMTNDNAFRRVPNLDVVVL